MKTVARVRALAHLFVVHPDLITQELVEQNTSNIPNDTPRMDAIRQNTNPERLVFSMSLSIHTIFSRSYLLAKRQLVPRQN